MLFGIKVLAGLISSNSSFSDLQLSGSLLFTGEEQRKQHESGTEKLDLDTENSVYQR